MIKPVFFFNCIFLTSGLSQKKKSFMEGKRFSLLHASTTYPPTSPPQGRELDVNLEAATSHIGKWMREEGISGLASDGSQVLVSIFCLFRGGEGGKSWWKRKGIANTHEMKATRAGFFVHSPSGVHGGVR